MRNSTEEASELYPYGRFKDSLTSSPLGWRSLQVRIREWQLSCNTVETPPRDDPSIHLLLDKVIQVEYLSEGQWRSQRYTKGTGLISPGGGNRRRLRLHFTGQRNLDVLNLILPQQIVDGVAQEVFASATTPKRSFPDVPFLNDRAISEFSTSVLVALQNGAPEFYAQSAAQWLAAHVLLGPFKAFEWHRSLNSERVSDLRLIRVMEYIDAHLADPLDLRSLSTEAGLSPFHFAALFSKAVGSTPHRHVTHLRIKTAKSMLRETNKSTLEIALSCGFSSASHFASTFRKESSQTPSQYRSSQRIQENL